MLVCIKQYKTYSFCSIKALYIIHTYVVYVCLNVPCNPRDKMKFLGFEFVVFAISTKYMCKCSFHCLHNFIDDKNNMNETELNRCSNQQQQQHLGSSTITTNKLVNNG